MWGVWKAGVSELEEVGDSKRPSIQEKGGMEVIDQKRFFLGIDKFETRLEGGSHQVQQVPANREHPKTLPPHLH